jgi:hypothetical protein
MRMGCIQAGRHLRTKAAPVASKTRPCTTAAAKAAEEATGEAHKSWSILNAQYLEYAKAKDCDDGAIAEGWDDGVARLLANSWADLPELARLVTADPDFLPFVIRHVRATAASEDLERARTSAKGRCREGHEELCRLIAEAVATALADSSCEYSHPPTDESDARRRLSARAPGVHWSGSLRVDLFGKGVPDFVMIGRTQSEAVVGVVLAAACDLRFVFRFKKDEGSQDGLCGEPALVQVSTTRLASHDDPDAPVAAKGAPDSRRRGFRLDSGECDSFHFYFDGLAVRWWRR